MRVTLEDVNLEVKRMVRARVCILYQGAGKRPRTKGTATRGPEGPESGQNMRVRGPEGPEDEQS